MGFNINEFSQSVATYGIQQSNKFDVTISLPPIIQNLVNNSSFPYLNAWQDLEPIRASNCTTPGVVLMSHETYPYGVGKKIRQPYNAAFTPMKISLLADEQNILEQTFNLWMNFS